MAANAVKEGFWSYARQAGFQRQRALWFRDTDEVIQALELQPSQYGPSYYVNIGFHLKQLADSDHPKPTEWHATQRLEILAEAQGQRKAVERLFDLDQGIEAAERIPLIEEALSIYAGPFIEQGETVSGLSQLHREGKLPAIRRPAYETIVGKPPD